MVASVAATFQLHRLVRHQPLAGCAVLMGVLVRVSIEHPVSYRTGNEGHAAVTNCSCQQSTKTLQESIC